MMSYTKIEHKSSRVPEELFCQVTVAPSLLGFEAGKDIALDDRLAIWRQHNTKFGLTGAILVSSDGIAIILEGTAAAIGKVRGQMDANPLHGKIQLIAYRPCFRRRFLGWPLAYVGPSRWVQNALADRMLSDMTEESQSDADFLIDLVLFLVGDAP